jgi:hypothetical protein
VSQSQAHAGYRLSDPTIIQYNVNLVIENDVQRVEFDGGCIDCGAERSVIGLSQARAYNQAAITIRQRKVHFRFANDVKQSIGQLPISIPTPEGSIEILVDVVDAPVPFLIGLDILDEYKLVCNNVDNRLERRELCNGTESSIRWTIPIVRKGGHLFVECNRISSVLMSDVQLLKIHKQFGHPSPEKLYDLIRRADPETDVKKATLQGISRECGTCQRFSKKPLCRQVSLPNDNVIFNRQVDLDILYINQKAILHMIDHDTRFAAARYVRESTENIWETFIQAWVLVYTG